jgi:hypothetical protein
MDEPGRKDGPDVWLLSLLYGRRLMGTGTKIVYGALALACAASAWMSLTAGEEATGISISKRILISGFFVLLAVSFVAMARSVDQLPPQDEDSAQDTTND